MLVHEVVEKWDCPSLAAVVKARAQNLLLRKELLDTRLPDEQLERLLSLVNIFLSDQPQQFLICTSVPERIWGEVTADIISASELLYEFFCERSVVAH